MLYLNSRAPLPRKPKQEFQSETPYGQPESGAATAARMKLSEKAAEVNEKVADFGRKTVDSIDESRKGTASALDQAAAKLHSSGDQLSDVAHTAADQISGVAHSAAEKLRTAADYIRETDLKGMGDDLKDIVKRYPGPALAAAAVLGFLVARGFRRD
jgi:ABC-type transporter Mla subunit MlaD